jgi:triosephosphate isomerase
MLIVGNWKAYVDTLEKAKRLHAAGKKLAANGTHTIVLAPPAPYLGYLAIGNRANIEFAVQDLSRVAGGAATGEITAESAATAGAAYAILGHSERRALGETDALVLEKVRNALAAGLTPILCIGEAKRDAEAHYLAHLRGQLQAVFEPLSPAERRKVVIAYEPIWAIGKSATEAIQPSDLTEMVLYLRKVLGEYLPGTSVKKIRIIYGGSVDPTNAKTLAATGIDGFLPGRASTETAAFGAIVKALP